MLARPHQQASRSHVYSAVSTDSSVDRAPRQQHQYFEKQRQVSQEELDQLNSVNRLARNREARRKLLNNYEQPASDRESWWRCTIKETPSPLKYQISGFIKELNGRQANFSFKSNGRKRDPMPTMAKGSYLLPGAYGYEDFGQRIKKMQQSYGFKDKECHSLFMERSTSNPDLGPFTYETENYMSISSNKEPSKASFFKSKNRRNVFPPKEGPSPGEYEEALEKPRHEITSVFKSRSGRFNYKNSIPMPGPGHYEPISAWIDSKQSQEFNKRGQFFTPSAKVVT